MKKIVSLLIVTLMLSTVAFGAVDGVTNTPDYTADSLTINYTGATTEKATVMVYAVGQATDTPAYDEGTHTLLGIDQAESGNSFTVNLPYKYVGNIVIAVGSEETATASKHNVDLTGGFDNATITSTHSETLDGKKVVLAKQVTIAKNAGLDNVKIDLAPGGVLKLTNNRNEAIDVKGDIWFNAGNIEPQNNKEVVKLEMADGSGKAYGFITRDAVTEGVYKIALSKGGVTKYAPFEITAAIDGYVKFAVGVTGVGADETVEFVSAGMAQ